MPVRARASVLVATDIKLHAKKPFSNGLIFINPNAPQTPAKIPAQIPDQNRHIISRSI